MFTEAVTRLEDLILTKPCGGWHFTVSGAWGLCYSLTEPPIEEESYETNSAEKVWGDVSVSWAFGNSADAAEKIRIAVTNFNITYLSAAVAAKKGFFRDENLDPKIIVMV